MSLGSKEGNQIHGPCPHCGKDGVVHQIVYEYSSWCILKCLAEGCSQPSVVRLNGSAVIEFHPSPAARLPEQYPEAVDSPMGEARRCQSVDSPNAVGTMARR